MQEPKETNAPNTPTQREKDACAAFLLRWVEGENALFATANPEFESLDKGAKEALLLAWSGFDELQAWIYNALAEDRQPIVEGWLLNGLLANLHGAEGVA